MRIRLAISVLAALMFGACLSSGPSTTAEEAIAIVKAHLFKTGPRDVFGVTNCMRLYKLHPSSGPLAVVPEFTATYSSGRWIVVSGPGIWRVDDDSLRVVPDPGNPGGC